MKVYLDATAISVLTATRLRVLSWWPPMWWSIPLHSNERKVTWSR
jgi:hypothetical protein